MDKPDLIDRKALVEQIRLMANRSSLGEIASPSIGGMEMFGLISNAPRADAKPVRHGKWKFIPHSYYEEHRYPDFHVYVTAHCTVCGVKHLNRSSVYERHVYRPEEYEYADGWKCDKKEEKAKTLIEAEKHRGEMQLARYCPNCGAKMDGGEDNGKVD